ncbi:MFS transporter [Clostridium gasigenes]|uniref:MFS transporter n=1 Tax=Clostridium gasigenes TaxID=94869 RepID=UPI001C0CF835|nr:MFS transporter [Clostridium gasigenes]MBU3102721.1 MFS transporter [Clostridium gasigenes]
MNFKILKDKNFSLLMFGKITSLVGSSMQTFALSLFVLATTGSATKFASILAVTMIPQLILGPFAGVFVDWFDRKKIIISLDILSGVVVSTFAVIYFITGQMPIGYIYILAITLSLISTLFQPTIQTIIPTITRKDDLIEVNSINSLIMSLGNVLAPLLAGILYGLVGLKIIFVINAISFFVSAFSECFLKIPKTNNMKEKPSLNLFWKDFSDGIKFSVKNKSILAITTLAMMLNFALGSFTIGTVYICKRILVVSDFQFGLAESVGVVAMIIASFTTSYFGKKYSVGKNIYQSLLAVGIITTLFSVVIFGPFKDSFASNLPPYSLLLVIISLLCLFIGIANIFIGTLFQKIVPLDYMGRVGTVLGTISMAAIPLSSMIFGILFDIMPTTIIFPISGIMVIIPVLLYKKVLLSVETGKCEDKEIEGVIG